VDAARSNESQESKLQWIPGVVRTISSCQRVKSPIFDAIDRSNGTSEGKIFKKGGRRSCRALTLATYSISANLNAMPRELKSTETSAHVSPKGERQSSPPSAAIPSASSSNASATAVSGVSIPRRAATTAAVASHGGSAGADDHGICVLNPIILPRPRGDTQPRRGRPARATADARTWGGWRRRARGERTCAPGGIARRGASARGWAGDGGSAGGWWLCIGRRSPGEICRIRGATVWLGESDPVFYRHPVTNFFFDTSRDEF
jgi:hypothetical protein